MFSQLAELQMFLTFMVLLSVHWIADFTLQTRWQGPNKSKNLNALSQHVAVYTSALLIVAVTLPVWTVGHAISFALINGAAHFCTDFVTSRVSAKLWAAKQEHAFWSMIGFDQLIHQLTLSVTLLWLFP